MTNKNDSSILKRWRDGQFRDNIIVNNIILTVFLLLALLSAYNVVAKARSQGKLARQADELIALVADNGLSQYWGQENYLRFYFIIEKDNITGYMINSISPITQNENIIFQGNSVYRRFGVEDASLIISRTQWTIDNNLTAYNAIQTIEDNGRIVNTVQEMRNGYLTISAQENQRRFRPVRHRANYSGQIPYFLDDFFIALAATENKQAEFLCLHLDWHSPGQLNPMQFIVQPGANIPAEIRSRYPDGRAAVFSMQDKKIDMIFDDKFNMLWQLGNNITIVETSYAEVAASFKPILLEDMAAFGIDVDKLTITP